MRPLLALLLSLALLGCASPLDAARVALSATVATYAAVEAPLETQRAADGKVCLDAPTLPADTAACLSGVRARWAPVVAASLRAYASIGAALALLHLAEAGEALGQGIDAAKVGAALAAAVDAVAGLQAAISGRPSSQP